MFVFFFLDKIQIKMRVWVEFAFLFFYICVATLFLFPVIDLYVAIDSKKYKK